ncbi:putative trypsin-like serine protease precursor [Neoconidiobolus thromboides FSU 785]|nr:putative trypsin-like serine protease precursor [Neoconidiobolus thromboides FSU 785]
MNLKLIALLVLTSLSQAANVLPTTRIIDGYEVSPKFKYPWILSLDLLGRHFCAGMAYKSNLIITAAHCTIFETEKFTASFHRHDLTLNEYVENGQRYQVIDRKAHPDYDANKFDLNDVAIWKIDGTWGLAQKDTFVIDDGTFAKSTNQLLVTVGWGATSEGSKGSNILLEVKVPTYDTKKCVDSYKSVNKIVNDTVMFCAGYPEGAKDACQGDSGGPIFKVEAGKTTLVGITSWGHGCARKNFPGIYTKLFMFKSFIEQDF